MADSKHSKASKISKPSKPSRPSRPTKTTADAAANVSPKPKKQKVKGNCFVIMPFGDWFDEYYDTIYKPAIQEARLNPQRADDLFRPSSIVNDIWSYTQSATIILADLTSQNPNVFYELGLAHAISKPAVLLTETMDDVPFDLRSLRIILFDKRDPGWGALLRSSITSSLVEVLANPELSVPPAFSAANGEGVSSKKVPPQQQITALEQRVASLSAQVRRQDSSLMVAGPSEANSLARRYARSHMPVAMIVERLTERGVPRNYAEQAADRAYRGEQKVSQIYGSETISVVSGSSPNNPDILISPSGFPVVRSKQSKKVVKKSTRRAVKKKK